MKKLWVVLEVDTEDTYHRDEDGVEQDAIRKYFLFKGTQLIIINGINLKFKVLSVQNELLDIDKAAEKYGVTLPTEKIIGTIVPKKNT